MNEFGIEVSNRERSRTPQEDTQCQITGDHESSQSLGHQLGCMQELNLNIPHICNVQLCLHVALLANQVGVFSAIGSPSPYLDYFLVAQWKRM